MRLGAAGNSSTANGYTKICTNEKQGAKIPLLKVLEILKNFFQEVFKQGLGQSPKVFFYHFYPVAERAPSAKIPLDGILLGAAGIRSTENGCI